MIKKHDLIQAIQNSLSYDAFEDYIGVEIKHVSTSMVDVYLTDYSAKPPTESHFRLYVADMSYEAPIDIINQDIKMCKIDLEQNFN